VSRSIVFFGRNGPGVVTGGDFPSDPLGWDTGCRPYNFPPCGIENATQHYKKCVSPQTPFVASCVQSCTNKNYTAHTYQQDKLGPNEGGVVTQLAYRESPNVHMMTAIQTSGPIIASFEVMSDFPTYSEYFLTCYVFCGKL
jgi:hypothetical protein